MATDLVLAPHVGTFIAAVPLASGDLLAVALAAGHRGEHRVNVLDTRSWKRVAVFPIPARARSGVTPLRGAGEVLFTSDDRSLSAFEARTGRQLWSRTFDPPESVQLLDARGDLLLITVLGERYDDTRIVRAADGTDQRRLSVCTASEMSTCALAPDGSLVIAGLRNVEVHPPGEEVRLIPYETASFECGESAAIDDGGRRLVFGHGRELLLTDLSSGETRSVSSLEHTVQEAGFLRGDPWAVDAMGALWVVGAEPRRLIELGTACCGGFPSPDASTLSYGDQESRCFRVRRIEDREEVFATIPGFRIAAVGIDAAGGLWVSSADKLLRLEPDGGPPRKVATGVQSVLRLADDAMLTVGGSVRLFPAGASKAKVLARSPDVAEVVGDSVCVSSGQVAEIWDLSTAARTFRFDLERSWLAESGVALRHVHLGLDGVPFVHTSDGRVYRATSPEDLEECAQLPSDGSLYSDPDGSTLHLVRGRSIVSIGVERFELGSPLPVAIESDVCGLAFSPSGGRMVVFHHDGRLSLIDRRTLDTVAIDIPESSAAERDPHQVFVLDLEDPQSCAFSRDESTLAFIHAGGISFADTQTGRLKGRVVVATSGREIAACDAEGFDWTRAPKRPLSEEFVASVDGTPLDSAGLRERYAVGVLGRLTR